MDSRPDDVFQPGDLVNNTYRVEAILGRGGTSVVFRARNEISGRSVAIKVLKSEFAKNDDYLVLLKREEDIREVRHDAVVRYGENHRTEDGHVYLLMDYVEGPGLDEKLKQGPMEARDLLVICRRVAEGLEAAHQRNIVHRDLSPDNIILRDGDPAQAVIIDFGIAKDTNPGAETIVGNEFAGKYAYAAPEQLSGHTDARSDIYSLGAMLLANFRGASPDVGRNPLEVVQKKSQVLDTQGVPEPLKTLIDRMTDPNPETRLQSATTVLEQIAIGPTPAAPAGANAPSDDDLSEATVVVRPLSQETAPEPASDAGSVPKKATPAKGSAPTEPARTSRGGLVALLLVLVLAGAGAGGYFMGFFDGLMGPKYPVADPFSLIVEKKPDLAPRAVGYVPSEQVQGTLTQLVEKQQGVAELTLATGDISETWGPDVLDAVELLLPLEEWRMAVNGNEARITGATTDRDIAEKVEAAFANGPPGALGGEAEIRFTQLFVSPDALDPILAEAENCGPLELVNVPAAGYGPKTPVEVAGRVADTASRIELFDALQVAARGRKIDLNVEVLNPTLCLLEQHLPKAPESDIDIAFTVGDRDEPNPSGRFFVGENPVIDVVLPPDVQAGYLTVSVLDVSGNVFHLLPNINRTDNFVPTLRQGQEGEARVRVAYSIADAATNGRLAFRVDDSTLGKSKVVVLHSSQPLFDGLRPMTESAVGYAEALQDRFEEDGDKILSLDTRILETAQP